MIRFSTVAANADLIDDAGPTAEPHRGPEQQHGAAERDRHARGRVRRERDGAPECGDAKPGQDINAPGFIKDRDAADPA